MCTLVTTEVYEHFLTDEMRTDEPQELLHISRMTALHLCGSNIFPGALLLLVIFVSSTKKSVRNSLVN